MCSVREIVRNVAREDNQNLVPICAAAISKGMIMDIERGNVDQLEAR